MKVKDCVVGAIVTREHRPNGQITRLQEGAVLCLPYKKNPSDRHYYVQVQMAAGSPIELCIGRIQLKGAEHSYWPTVG